MIRPSFKLLLCLSLSSNAIANLHLGSRTPYHPQKSSHTCEIIPSHCEPIFFSMLGRHGSRYMDSLSEIQNLTKLFDKARHDSSLTKKGESIHHFVKEMEKIKPKGDLTLQGELELYAMGRRAAYAYPDVFSNKPILCEHTLYPRTKQTLEAFKKGLMSVNQSPHFEDLEKQICQDLDLFFFANCKKYHGYFEGESKNRSRFIASKILSSKTSRALIDKTLSEIFQKTALAAMSEEEKVVSVIQLYTLCGYEHNIDSSTAEHKTCSILSQELRALLVLAKEDLSSFYRSGPVHHYENAEYKDLSQKMTCMPLKSFIKDFDEAIQSTSKYSAHLRFAHGETVLPLAVLMGILKTDSDLGTEKNPEWESSKIISMASNIQLALYRCTQDKNTEYSVRLFYNEKEVHFPIPECQNSYACDWNLVKAYYENRMKELGVGSCSTEEWNKACGLESSSEGENLCKKAFLP